MASKTISNTELHWKTRVEQELSTCVAPEVNESWKTLYERLRKDVFTNGDPSLHSAVSLGCDVIVSRLLDEGADVNQTDSTIQKFTPLHWAAMEGHKIVMEILLEAGGDIHKETAFYLTPASLAISKKHHALYPLLYKTDALQIQALFDKAVEGDMETVDHLLAAGLNIRSRNDYKENILHDVLRSVREKSKSKTIQELVLRGAEVNVQDEFGITPLHIAYEKGDLDSASILLKNGAHLGIKDNNGDTAIHWALWRGNPSVLWECEKIKYRSLFFDVSLTYSIKILPYVLPIFRRVLPLVAKFYSKPNS